MRVVVVAEVQKRGLVAVVLALLLALVLLLFALLLALLRLRARLLARFEGLHALAVAPLQSTLDGTCAYVAGLLTLLLLLVRVPLALVLVALLPLVSAHYAAFRSSLGH